MKGPDYECKRHHVSNRQKKINKVAKDTGFIKRERDLTGFNFLVLMVFGLISLKVPSLGGLVDAIKIKISREALHKRFTCKAVAFLKQVLISIQRTCIEQRIDSKFLDVFSKVIICDSTWWEIKEKLQHIFRGFGGDSPKAQCKLQLVYDFLIGQIDSTAIVEGVRNDTTYSHNLLKRLTKGTLLLIDLGYFSVKFFEKIHNKGAYFISRLKSSTRMFHPSTLKEINLLKVLKKIQSDRFEANILLGLHVNLSVPCRLIGFRVPKEVAQKRRRKYKVRKGVKMNPKEITLKLCDWTLMITNVPSDLLPAEKVYDFYRIRWQIEIMFKQFKSILQLNKINTGNEHRLLCEVYGKLIAAVIISRIHSSLNIELWNKEKREVSIEKFFKRIQERAFTLMTLLQMNFHEAIKFMETTIKKCFGNCLKLIQRSRLSSLERLNSHCLRRFERIQPGQLFTLS